MNPGAAQAGGGSPATSTGEFVSRVGHELRTPLNAILGFAQMLEMGELGERERADVERILAAGRHLEALIADVLDVWRLDLGTDDLTIEPVDVCALVREAVELSGALCSDRGLELSLELPPNSPHCSADRQRASRMLVHLLSSATTYSRDGVSVTVAVADEGDAVSVRVTGGGVGIMAEEAGLALTLSKRYVERMGGEIGVASSPGSEATVGLRLPKVHGGAVRAPDAEPSLEASPRDDASRTVLCIEDTRANAALLGLLLDSRPEIRLLTAADGPTGLEIAQRERPDLVLLDLNPVDAAGIDLVRELSASDETSGVAVVVLSADATPGRAEQVARAGAREHLTKPVDVGELLRILEGALGPAAR